MGKVWGEEVEFDPIFKKWGRFGCSELGKSVFRDKGFPAVSKKVRDTGASWGSCFKFCWFSDKLQIGWLYSPFHHEPHCHRWCWCSASLGHTGSPLRADFMSIDLSSDSSVHRFITKHCCSRGQWRELYSSLSFACADKQLHLWRSRLK